MAGENVVPFRRPLVDRDRPTNDGSYRKNDGSFQIHRLKRYLSPQIAEMILKCPDEDSLWEFHRRDITVVFLDLRGFISFADSAEPEEVMALLRSYHEEMGKVIFKFEGTLERFTVAGIKVFLNDPIPCPDHTVTAVRMALEMQDRAKDLRIGWQKKGYELDLGIGLAAGYATVGNFGFKERMDYGPVGKITNLAQRLCEEAGGGQILTNQKTLSKIEESVEAEPLNKLHFKGFRCPTDVFNIVASR